MILGDISREKLIAEDFIKQISVTDGGYAVSFYDKDGKQVCCIPTPSLTEALECANIFHTLVEQAIQQHNGESKGEQQIVDDFHKLLYAKGKITPDGQPQEFALATYHGLITQKNPLDLWIYQEIITETQPDLIIELGTASGGSALFMAHVLDVIGRGKIVTVDVETDSNRPEHSRITYLHGDTLDPTIQKGLQILASNKRKVMIILDDDHSASHVLHELDFYSQMVSAGQYLIVEDSNINGHPVFKAFGPGPAEALKEFLKTHDNFEVDMSREKFMVTQNPGGYLKKKG